MKWANVRLTWVWPAIALAGAVLAGSWIVRQMREEVAVFVVDQGRIDEWVERRGVTRLPEVVEITMPATARLAPITVEVGQTVRKGDVVARLVRKDIDLALARAQHAADELEAAWREARDQQLELDLKKQAGLSVSAMQQLVAAAKARTEESKQALVSIGRILERTRKLTREEVRSEDELDRTEIDFIRFRSQYEQDQHTQQALELLQQATALLPAVVDDYIRRRGLAAAKVEKQLQRARAGLEESRLLLERSQMTSPIDGVILSRATTNEKVVPEGTVLLRIGDLSRLEARVDVLTQEALRISEGNRVELEVGGGRPESVFHWKGHVARIDPEGFTKVSSLGIEQQRVWVTIRFDPETRTELLSRKMGAGYRVRARILTGSRNKVLRIPRTALFRSETGRWEVWVARSGKLQRSAVEIGLANDRWAEVRKGLSAGDQVIVAPHTRLVTGQRVVTRVIKPSWLDPRSREP